MNVGRAVLVDRLATVHAHQNRVDTKAGLLLAIAGTALTGGTVVLVTGRLPGPAVAPAVAAVLLVGAATVLLLSAVRPTLAGNHGMVRWARTAPAEMQAEAVLHAGCTQDLAGDVVAMSQLAIRKYRRVRIAVDLLVVALVAAGLAAAATALVGGEN